MTGQEIAHRAQQLIGAPFRLRGRDGKYGVDCVGLVTHAANLDETARDYALRGDYEERVATALQAAGFASLADQPLINGDIILLRCAPRQLHLAVVANNGAIHAHAGLRRVVWTPVPLPWPLVSHWRISGE